MPKPAKRTETPLEEFGPIQASDFAKAENSRVCWTQLLHQQEEGELLRLQLHLKALVEADPKEARAAMEMSQEHLPEVFQIAKMYSPREWPQALMNSDSMNSLLSRSPSPVKELLAKPDLRSLLEMFP
ncbi:hypothetical protein [Hydrogenophaga sp.]|uniref:hypothetical protein n=1 Tax=Hydrogenophaga sp. TaxID=1904254 RepID=UPI002627803F|nr:hypothetical protein [Hydrogenophaga sp.]